MALSPVPLGWRIVPFRWMDWCGDCYFLPRKMMTPITTTVRHFRVARKKWLKPWGNQSLKNRHTAKNSLVDLLQVFQSHFRFSHLVHERSPTWLLNLCTIDSLQDIEKTPFLANKNSGIFSNKFSLFTITFITCTVLANFPQTCFLVNSATIVKRLRNACNDFDFLLKLKKHHEIFAQKVSRNLQKVPARILWHGGMSWLDNRG